MRWVRLLSGRCAVMSGWEAVFVLLSRHRAQGETTPESVQEPQERGAVSVHVGIGWGRGDRTLFGARRRDGPVDTESIGGGGVHAV